jgi:pilus assembly protein CpaE
MESHTLLLAGVRPQTEARLREAFSDVEVAALPGGRWVRETLGELSADAAVVKLDGDLERSFALVREMGESGIRVLVLGPAKDPDLILRAMREGAKEFVVSDDDAAILRAVGEQLRPLRGTGGGLVTALFPAKGGVGATTIATNLAGALQRSGERACLVDLNLNMGDVLAFLDLAGGYSISDVVANLRRIDRELLDSSVLRHASGIHVLAQSHRVEEADKVDPTVLGSVLSLLRQHYGAVVLDGLRSFDDLSVAAIDAADQILLVVAQEVPAVRDARRCVDLFRRLGAEGKLKLVVNRFQTGREITPQVVADTVGVAVAATVANDYPTVIRAVDRGQLLLDEAPRAQVTRDVENLVAVLGHVRPAAGENHKRSFLHRFFSSKVAHAAE